MRRLFQVFPEGPIGGGGSRGTVGTAVAAPRVTFDQGFAAIGQGLDAFAARIEEDNQQASKIAAIEAKGAFRYEVEKGLAELDPTAHDYLDRSRQLIESARSARGASPGVVSPDVQDALALDLATMGEAYFVSAADGRRGALAEKATTTLNTETTAAAGRIYADPDAFGLHVSDWERSTGALFDSIPPEQRDALRDAAIKTMISSQIEGLSNDGRFDEARDLLKSFGTDITDSERRSLAGVITAVENQHQNEFKSRTAELHAAHRIQIADVDPTHDPDAVQKLDAIRDRIEASAAKGLYAGAPDKLASNIAVLMTARARAIEEGRTRSVAVEKFQAGAILLQDELDDYVWPALKQQLAADGADEETFLATLDELGRSQGKLPSEITDRLKAAEFADNPTVLAQNAQLNDRLTDANPRLDTKAGDVVKDVSLMKRLLNSSYEDAAKWVLERSPDPALRDKRAQAFKPGDKGDASVRDVTAERILEGTFGLLGGESGVISEDLSLSPFALGVAYPAQAEAEALSLYQEAYIRFGDKKIALERTRAAMQERWQVTRAGGTPRLAEHPIERFLPAAVQPDPAVGHQGFTPEEQGALIDEWVAKHVGGELTRGYQLLFTDRSRRQLGAGVTPEYQLFEPDPQYPSVNRPVLKRHKETGETSPVFIPVPKMDDVKELPTWKSHVEAQTNPGLLRRLQSTADAQIKAIRERNRVLGDKGLRQAVSDELGFARRRERQRRGEIPGALDQIRGLFGGGGDDEGE